MSKKYDVLAVTGSYLDQQGQQKNRYQSVGAVVANANGGFTLLLEKWFNPAGLAQADYPSVSLMLVEPKPKQAPQQQQQQSQSGYQQPQGGYQAPQSQIDPPF